MFDGWNRSALWRAEGPVLGPRGTGGDPLLEEIFLSGGECAVRLWRRHHLLRIVAEDAGDEFAVVGLTGDNGDESGFTGGEGGVAQVEAEAALARLGIGAVAAVTVFREDRLDVAGEIYWRLGGTDRSDEQAREGGEKGGETQGRAHRNR